MAEVDAGSLTEKIGPLPAYVWGGALVGGFLLWRHHAAQAAADAAAQTADPTSDPTATDGETVPADPFGTNPTQTSDPLSQLDITDPAYPVGATAQGVPAPITNTQWSRLVANYLMAHGDDPSLVQSALASYLSGGSLSAAYQAVVSQGLTAFGTPPEGVVPVVPAVPTGTTATGAPAAPKLTGSASGTRCIFVWDRIPNVAGYLVYYGSTVKAFTIGRTYTGYVRKLGYGYGPVTVVAVGLNGKRSARSNAVTVKTHA